MLYGGESDRELVSRFVAGDTAVFDILHRRYYEKIFRLAYMQARNEQDAEDIAAETFCRAFQRLHQFTFAGCDSVYPWLHRIAVNISIDLCRDKAARQTVSLDVEMADGVHTILDNIEDTKPSPQEVLEEHEVQELVRSAIAALLPDQRDVIVHRFLGELSLNEIAEEMHRTEGAVKSLLRRGLTSLRKEIIKRLSEVERVQMLGQRKESTDVRGDSVRIHRRTDQTK